MLSEIFGSWPHFAEDERSTVQQILKSGRVNYWTGEHGREFEKEFAAFFNTKHAIALANGTVALELALYTLGIGAGDDVIVTPRTFLASASCAVMRGARPVFADIDADSENISAATIEAALTPATRAVIVVHHAGWPCEMDEIMALAERHNFYVIEDCAQAHGAMYRQKPVGCHGHIAAFSFCQDKIMTTGGEGGMLATNNTADWKRAWAFKDHGKNYDAVFNKDHPAGFRWLHDSFGTNWRLTEMQSAIGRLQLHKLPKWIEQRTQNAEHYRALLSQFNCVRVPVVPAHMQHAYYRLYFHVRPEQLKSDWNRDRIMTEMGQRGMPIFSGSCPEIYKEKAFTSSASEPPAPMPVAESLGKTSLALLVHPTLTQADLDLVSEHLVDILTQASAT